MTHTGRGARAAIGIIGGSGVYDVEGLQKMTERSVRTPFGSPSDKVRIGELNGERVAFLSRHGRGHRLNPSEINYRANIYALKAIGVQRVISVSAVGSMKAAIKPGDVVLPDQFIDWTKGRASTFFEGGLVAHLAFGEPTCPSLAANLEAAARAVGASVHRGGVYLCVEGPQFSTQSESRLYRQWGIDVIGMTNMPEAKLAREAELCYATVALVTDYDCWHATEAAVSVDAILAVLKQNGALARRMLGHAVPLTARLGACACHRALQDALVTSLDQVPAVLRRKLGVLLARIISAKKGTR